MRERREKWRRKTRKMTRKEEKLDREDNEDKKNRWRGRGGGRERTVQKGEKMRVRRKHLDTLRDLKSFQEKEWPREDVFIRRQPFAS